MGEGNFLQKASPSPIFRVPPLLQRNIGMHRPNAAGADAGADAASDAPIGIGNIPIRAARQCFPADGPLRAGFQAHSAIPAGPATDTTVKIPVRGRQLTMRATGEIRCAQLP